MTYVFAFTRLSENLKTKVLLVVKYISFEIRLMKYVLLSVYISHICTARNHHHHHHIHKHTVQKHTPAFDMKLTNSLSLSFSPPLSLFTF